jgi:hypothetical protein
MFWVPLAAGAALGGVKSLIDGDKEKQERNLQAETARYSPWTKLDPNNVKVERADPFGSILQGGVTGLAMADALKKLKDGEVLDDAKRIGDLAEDQASDAFGKASGMLGLGGQSAGGGFVGASLDSASPETISQLNDSEKMWSLLNQRYNKA